MCKDNKNKQQRNDVPQEIDKAIGNRLSQAREYLGISVEQMAILMGTSSDTIRCVEQGKQIIPFIWVYILSRFFDINANWLLTGNEYMSPRCLHPSCRARGAGGHL